MAKSLTEDEKAFRAYDRATKTGLAALAKIVEIHVVYKDGAGIRICSLCFKNWPCETYQFAETALNKMKGQLPQ